MAPCIIQLLQLHKPLDFFSPSAADDCGWVHLGNVANSVSCLREK
jgi:hypothetical protein